ITGYLCGKGNTNGYSEILDVNIPASINGITITKIGSSAFSNKGLTAINIPNTVTAIESQAFLNNQIKQVSLPNSVKVIGNHAFASNRLTELEIPSSVTFLGMSAFRVNQLSNDQAFIYNRNSDGTEDRSSLNSYAGAERTKVVVPDQITTIESQAFLNCSISEIQFPNQLTTIGSSAFFGNSLTSIIFPPTLKSIQSQAFQSVYSLTRIEFQGNAPAVGVGVLRYMGANTIKVPSGTLEQYKNVKNGTYSPSQLWFGTDNESVLDAFYE
ncbi:MAG: leucine-rich repeat domain-containing protein, partial [Bacilli bacterium]|nr:leucine-rich repeat domain-containing protein [Bacilli bacterium]